MHTLTSTQYTKHKKSASFWLISPISMASMGFSYAQIHVQQGRCKRNNEQKMKKLMAEEEEEEKKKSMCEEGNNKKSTSDEEKACYSWTSERVHPCSSSASKIGR
ncbi:hypothetical protein ABZP36_028922 [Zizania latifolia]